MIKVRRKQVAIGLGILALVGVVAAAVNQVTISNNSSRTGYVASEDDNTLVQEVS